jgi:hypothetical protein
LPASVEQIGQLHLRLVRDTRDPQHLLWNRLIIRQHPLKAAPLVGAQLRYLICSEAGVLGAIGFGPAAFHLECRDGWIGWDRQAQARNRPLVVCLSRFLIREGVQCANFASRVYSMVLRRVAQDWQQRYGDQPVLVETYVNRSTHTGRSLAAANWRRLGTSTGRGRSSPSRRIRPQSPKDVWIYPLHPKARQRLQRRAVEPLPARSVFHPPQDWISQELDGLDLGHALLNRRWQCMLRARWENPQRSFGASFQDRAQAKGAYRLLESGQAAVCFEKLLAPHHQQTQRRMAAESVVLLAQDTTPLSYNGLLQTQGLGSLGSEQQPGRGLWLHSLQAYRLDGIPLGCAWAHLWARTEPSDTAQRNEQSVADKESHRWIQAYQVGRAAAQAMPQTQLIICGDRESDLFELHDQTQGAPKNLRVLVRAQHDRTLESGQKLWEHLSRQPVGGRMEVAVPRSKNRWARQSCLALRWSRVELSPPAVALKKSWRPLSLYVVMAREIDPPPGVEPIEWVLLTDWKVDSLKMARRMVRWYGLRWGIECWHQVLKDVCGVETRQMETAQALGRALVLDMMVAWRAQLLCRLGKQSPNLPASLYYSFQELRVLEVHRQRLPQWAHAQPPQPHGASPGLEQPQSVGEKLKRTGTLSQHQTDPSSLSLLQANLLVAMLAGFPARKGDGHPGPKTLSRGLEILVRLVELLELVGVAQEPRPKSPRRGKRAREPD